ncbi:LysR family transcriptional regulator [Mesorhizobium sp. B3-1-9]|nr:LysR family transcriptional regulator [Mesorhizobium sp. B3-1-9]TPI63753.1 LysR family transcriptional regulator [Mesorhizobium sp. B3-1-3]TPI65607.1 LysR family transcriptional regulator [Mesorhizobium sp. B3-1-8]
MGSIASGPQGSARSAGRCRVVGSRPSSAQTRPRSSASSRGSSLPIGAARASTPNWFRCAEKTTIRYCAICWRNARKSLNKSCGWLKPFAGRQAVGGTNKLHFVNFSQLRSFYAVGRELSFTKAADLLCIGQPTVTTQVKALEETYDVQLFLRSPRGLKLTDAGEALLTVARQIFSLEEQAVGILRAEGNQISGKLRVGTVGPFFVMELLSAFHAQYPLVQVSLESGNSDVVYNKLMNYEVDVAIIGRDYDDPRLDLVQLGRHEVIIFVHRNHPWAGRQQIDLEELDGQRMIFREPGSMTRRALEEMLELHRIRPNVVMEIPRDGVREAVAAGLGAGIVSKTEFQLDDRLTPLSIADHKPFTESFATCLKARQELRPIGAFMKLVTEVSNLKFNQMAAAVLCKE